MLIHFSTILFKFYWYEVLWSMGIILFTYQRGQRPALCHQSSIPNHQVDPKTDCPDRFVCSWPQAEHGKLLLLPKTTEKCTDV